MQLLEQEVAENGFVIVAVGYVVLVVEVVVGSTVVGSTVVGSILVGSIFVIFDLLRFMVSFNILDDKKDDNKL